jgi:hypothetical protein
MKKIPPEKHIVRLWDVTDFVCKFEFWKENLVAANRIGKTTLASGKVIK